MPELKGGNDNGSQHRLAPRPPPPGRPRRTCCRRAPGTHTPLAPSSGDPGPASAGAPRRASHPRDAARETGGATSSPRGSLDSAPARSRCRRPPGLGPGLPSAPRPGDGSPTRPGSRLPAEGGGEEAQGPGSDPSLLLTPTALAPRAAAAPTPQPSGVGSLGHHRDGPGNGPNASLRPPPPDATTEANEPGTEVERRTGDSQAAAILSVGARTALRFNHGPPQLSWLYHVEISPLSRFGLNGRLP